jgi:hypothetical protein
MGISAISTCSAVSSRIWRPFLNAFIAILFLLISVPAFAGAWVQKQGHGEFIANATYFTTDEYYDRNGDSTSQTRFDKFELQPYLEYGVTKSITLGGSLFLQRAVQGDKHNNGIADPELFLRKQIYRDNKNVVSLQPLIKFASNFNHEATPRGGSGSTDAEISLLYGRNLNLISPRDYADFRLGYRTRSDDLNDQIRADAALGLRVSDAWEIIPGLRYVKATSLGSATAFSENGEQNYDLLKAELGANYYLNNTRSLRANLFSHVAGKQTGSGQGVTVGYAVKF